jgi:nucleoside-diphosphate-sugar epimerase
MRRESVSRKKTILITGGAGFIGTNLIRTLLTEANYQLHTVVAPNTNLWRLTNILPNITVHEIDLSNTAAITTLVHTIKPTIIYHLAAYGGMPNERTPNMIYDVNFYGTLNLLQACKEVGFDCFINTGSSSEYGMKQEPMDEAMALEPLSDYGVAKAAATNYCQKEALFNKLPIYTIRPFSVYGDYELSTRLMPTIIVNALANKPITLSSQTHVRDFIYIHDLINAYLKITERRPSHAHIFNIGSGQQSTIADVVSHVQSIMGKQLNVIWGSAAARPWEPTRWQANIDRAQTVLEWHPTHTLEQGLRASITWFNANLSWYLDRKDSNAHANQATTPGYTNDTTKTGRHSTSMSS